jgi:putative transposase
MLALNRELYQIPRPRKQPRGKQLMPFRASYRHQFWTADIRYLDMHRVGGGMIYVIAIMENYSRAILASAISRRQDTTAFLRVLHAAIEMHGSPDGLVTDNAGVFHAKKALEIYAQLGIAKHAIGQGAAVAVVYRNDLCHPAAHGRLRIRAGHDVGRLTGGA